MYKGELSHATKPKLICIFSLKLIFLSRFLREEGTKKSKIIKDKQAIHKETLDLTFSILRE